MNWNLVFLLLLLQSQLLMGLEVSVWASAIQVVILS